MEAFGNRIHTLRKELGLSQQALADAIEADQPRIHRYESGELPASVDVINKLAAALKRLPLDLVTGTDREGYYLANALSPDELSQLELSRRISREVDALWLLATYQRVVAMFEALHVGPYIVTATRGEEAYLNLREQYNKFAARLDNVPSVHFPDHFELVDEDEALAWEFEQKFLRESMLELRKYVHAFNINPGARELVEKTIDERLADFDSQTERLREDQMRENKEWVERLERLKAEGRLRFGDRTP